MEISIEKLLEDLYIKGISLWMEDGKLHFKAPKGSISKDELNMLKENKEKIIDILAVNETIKIIPDIESRYEPFPCTDIQSAYLLGRRDSFEYGGVACHIYLELEYDQLDPKKTEKIWNKLIKRHDMLRVKFDKSGNQYIQKEVDYFKITYNQYSGLNESVLIEKMNEIRRNMGNRVYDIEKWPLFDIQLTKTNNNYIMHFSIEFIIADWTSIRLLLNEFDILNRNIDEELPKLELTFRDYILAANKLKKSKQYIEDKNYWMQRVDTLPPAPKLPILVNEKIEKVKFKRHTLHIKQERWNILKDFAKKNGLTPTATVLTAFSLIIERWSTESIFCLNLTLLNRMPIHPQVNDIVGDFTTINLLEINLKDIKTFIEYAQEIQKRLFDDLDHKLFSGVEVIRELARRHSNKELMPIIFTSAIGSESTNVASSKIEVNENGISQTPQVFIDCQAMDDENGLRINWDVRDKIFPQNMIKDMFNSFEELLNRLIEIKETWNEKDIVKLPLWQQDERIIVNDTSKVLPDKLLHQQIYEQAGLTPDNIAVKDGNNSITYRELIRLSDTISAYLLDAGCKPQDRIAIVMEKSIYQVASVLGILNIGGIYIPISNKQPVSRIESIIQQSSSDIILMTSLLNIKLDNNYKVIEVDKLVYKDQEIERYAGNSDNTAYIIFTSGSTGVPKGVTISHKAAMNTINDINDRFKVTCDDSILGISKLSFDLSVYDIFGLLSVGGKVIYPSDSKLNDPSYWQSLISENNITMWNTVPAIMEMLINYLEVSNNSLTSMKKIFLSGDWIGVNLPNRIKNKIPNANIICMGGATEASIWSIYHIYNDSDKTYKSIPYGRPLANQQFKVFDSKLRDCPVLVEGELGIMGQGLSKGYLEQKEVTAKCFIAHEEDIIYRTGDYGRYLPSGEIEFLGRKDTQVKIRGHRIELGEIESALNRHEKVKSAVVIATTENKKQLYGYVILDNDQKYSKVTEYELKEYLALCIPKYMIPFSILILSNFPLTQNGKVDRKKLLNIKMQKACDKNKKEVFDQLELKLKTIIESALEVKEIGKKDDFYDYGADSLIMAQTAGVLHEELLTINIDISYDALLRQLLNYPTINSLAEFVRQQVSTKDQIVDSVSDSSNASIIEYSKNEDGPLRVILHAGLGTMNCFRYLIKYLVKQDIGTLIGVAVKDAEKYSSIKPEELIEHIADDYVERIMKYNNNDVQIIGYSLGGLIAVEVAKRLAENNVNIVDLVLIDSYSIQFDIKDKLFLESIFITNFYINLSQVYDEVTIDELDYTFKKLFDKHKDDIPEDALCNLDGDNIIMKVSNLFKRLSTLTREQRFSDYVDIMYNITGEKIPVDMVIGMFNIFYQSFKAAQFEPSIYMGDVRFLLAREEFQYLADSSERTLDFWKQYCLGEFEVTRINGDHISCIEDEENVLNLAKLVVQPLL
ncbi:amino acid adenylation domain-containing protein [Vallitalea sp.]|jgi:pyochelin synthetase|uniref:amino acid adenylation domain-containing protein n=1 Tax=Vallitalea sp. TaxID=1882829 RepID=UPI0025EA72EB|nr:amino acid adenylation domain-containing protein [Vallitalea sp.]MCT4687859.1 amino acid adenylation domain-containing protein [Vallitalea sp.]